MPNSGATLEADYVVVGAGAAAMSFADVVLTESDRDLVIVDEHAQPGGHWNHAYSFVRLHQPSAYYGVPSRPLGRQVRDAGGLNDGLFEQATGYEVLTYLDDVMREQFLPSGRVTYLPMHKYFLDGTVVSGLTGRKKKVHARRRLVDASYLGSDVPSVHTPPFDIAEGVTVIPINDLTSVRHPPAAFVVLGAGKTSIDACLWLLGQGVAPERIRWVRPHDLWLLNRVQVQPDAGQLVAFADMLEAAAEAEGSDDLVARLERADLLLRVDPLHWPTTFRGATASPREVAELRRITDVIRLGHVTRLEPGVAHCERGDVPIDNGSVYVDCTAEGLRRRPSIPIFQTDRITLQYTMLFGVPTYSAALIARTEVSEGDDEAKNAACPALPVPNHLGNIAQYLMARLEAPQAMAQIEGLNEWNDATRLNPGSWALASVDPKDEQAQVAIVRIFEHSGPALENLRRIASRSNS